MASDESLPPLLQSQTDNPRSHRSYSFSIQSLKDSNSQPQQYHGRTVSERFVSRNVDGLFSVDEDELVTSLSPSGASREFRSDAHAPSARQTSAGDMWAHQSRSRSKSSSAVIVNDEWPEEGDVTYSSSQPPSFTTLLTVKDASPGNNIGTRRGSAGTISSIWSPVAEAFPDQRKMSGPLPMMDVFVPLEDDERQRRYSHSPMQIFDKKQEYPPLSQTEDLRSRRHSVGTPILFGKDAHVHGEPAATQQLVEAFSNLQLPKEKEPSPGVSPSQLNDYFEQHNRARAWVEGARNLQQMQHTSGYRWPLFVVEFKAGRKDFFHVPDAKYRVSKGDFVMVEADRGEDLGKIVVDNLRNQQDLQNYQQQNAANLLENQFGRDVQPKKILRLADAQEMTMLAAKIADEERAMAVCQQKVRSKRFPMEVVDAEYQWYAFFP
jgi:hypothetical protein